jgi:hypothetical protein
MISEPSLSGEVAVTTSVSLPGVPLTMMAGIDVSSVHP